MKLFLLLLLAALQPVEAFFSPNGGIKGRILTAIQSSESSIDIAAYKFTSADLAEALLEAKKRGVRIRLLMDYEEAQKGISLAPFLKQQGLSIKFLTGRLGGQMHFSFAIFDSSAVLAGSYTFTEYAERYNYENALFIREPKVVARYQAHFNKLFQEGTAKTTQ